MTDFNYLWNYIRDLDVDTLNSLNFHDSETVNGFNRQHSGIGNPPLLSCEKYFLGYKALWSSHSARFFIFECQSGNSQTELVEQSFYDQIKSDDIVSISDKVMLFHLYVTNIHYSSSRSNPHENCKIIQYIVDMVKICMLLNALFPAIFYFKFI
jgi:hypothetical protein